MTTKSLKYTILAWLVIAVLCLAACNNSNRASDGEAAPENIGPVSDSVGEAPDTMGNAGDTTINPQDSAQPAP